MKVRYCSASASIGDAREVDLLVARQMQQQVERAFEAGDVDDQRRVVGWRA